MQPAQVPCSNLSFVDDTLLLIRSEQPELLRDKLSVALLISYRGFAAHGLVLNLTRGKSEAIIAYSGKGCRV